jgi:hypothetical protein
MAIRNVSAQSDLQDTTITLTSADDLLRQIEEIEAIRDTSWIKTGMLLWNPGTGETIDDTMQVITRREVLWVATIPPGLGTHSHIQYTDAILDTANTTEWGTYIVSAQALVRTREVR